MATSDLLASTVMDQSAALLNDPSRTVYTYDVMIPYLQMALQELREEFEQNSIPVTELTSEVITVPAGTDEILFNGVSPLTLPSDMIEPLQLWERESGVDPYVPMTRRDFLPHNLEGNDTNHFGFYVWQSQAIKVLPSNRINDIKIDYVKELFATITAQDAQINVINGATFLQYRTAALLSEFIERNITSSDRFNQYALLGMNRVTGIASKGKQNIMTRRRPFRASYKMRGYSG
jgi:hypothetical protein